MRIFGFDQYGGDEATGFHDVDDPTPGPDQVLIRMVASGLNPADVKVRDGARAGSVPVNFPMAMGREAAGIVLEVGEHVAHSFSPGDRVFGAAASGTGTYAEKALLNGTSTAHIPDGVTDAQAASIPVAIGTAYDALNELDLPAGSRLVMLGASGGVGTAVCGLARLRGLQVAGTASPSKAHVVRFLGATYLNRQSTWADQVLALAPDGVEGIVDAAGGDTLREACHLVKNPAMIRSAADHELVAELGGSAITRRRTTEVFTEIAELIAAEQFTPVVSEEFAFDDAAAAVARLESGRAKGNIVLLGPDL